MNKLGIVNQIRLKDLSLHLPYHVLCSVQYDENIEPVTYELYALFTNGETFYRDGGSYGLCVGFPPLDMPSGYDVIDARVPAWSLSALLEWVKTKAIAFDVDASICLESYGLEWARTL